MDGPTVNHVVPFSIGKAIKMLQFHHIHREILLFRVDLTPKSVQKGNLQGLISIAHVHTPRRYCIGSIWLHLYQSRQPDQSQMKSENSALFGVAAWGADKSVCLERLQQV